MRLHYTLMVICACFVLLCGVSAHAATINYSDHDNDGDHNPNIGSRSSHISWSGDGDKWDGSDKSKDDPDNHKNHTPPPSHGIADFGDGWKHDKKYSGDKDDYRRYYADICDKDRDGGRHHWHDPPCDPGDPVPLPGTFPMFGAGLLVLVGYRLSRCVRFVSGKPAI